MDEIWKDIETIPYHQAAWPFHQVSKNSLRSSPELAKHYGVASSTIRSIRNGTNWNSVGRLK